MAVGIGITTYNRSEMLKNILPLWINRSPREFVFCVHIDGESKKGYEWIYRYPYVHFIRDFKRKGIAASKNACMDYLAKKGCDEIFMIDDDVYPKTTDWYEPFQRSQMIHSCYITETEGGIKTLAYTDTETAFAGCPGCLLYFREKAAKERYNEDFGIYGFEHVEITERIWKKYRGIEQPLSPSAYVAPVDIQGKFFLFDLTANEEPEFEFDKSLRTTSLHGEDVQSYIDISAKVKQEIDKK